MRTRPPAAARRRFYARSVDHGSPAKNRLGSAAIQTSPPSSTRRRSVAAGIGSPAVSVALGAASLAVLALAGTRLRDQDLSPAVGLALGSGLALWLAAVMAARPPAVRVSPIVQARPIRWALVVVAVGACAATWVRSGDGVYTWANVFLWGVAVAVWCAAWWPRQASAGSRDVAARLRGSAPWLVPLCLIVGLAAFYRFYALTDVPSEPTSDHAEKLLDVHDVLAGQHPIFFERNTGREPAQFYFTVALIKLFGLPATYETLKLGTALIGLLAVPAVFLFVRQVGGLVAGLTSAAFVAVSPWPVALSRFGLRFPYAMLGSALALWLLFRYVRRRDRRDALWLGLALAFGLHGYTSFRIVPFLVPLVLGVVLLYERGRGWRTVVADGGLALATAFVACLPLAHFTAQHPDLVFERVRSRTEAELGWTGTLDVFAENVRNALLGFNWRGDSTLVNLVTYEPLLDVVAGAALLAGVVVAGYRATAKRDPSAAAVLLAVPVLLLPSTLGIAFPIENPSAARLSTAVPAVFALVGLPFGFLASVASRPTRGAAAAASFAAAGALALVGATYIVRHDYVEYFDRYADQISRNVPNANEIAATIREREHAGIPVRNVFFLSYPYWADVRNVGFALERPTWWETNLLEPGSPFPARFPSGPLLFVLEADDSRRRQELARRFPDGSYRVVTPTRGYPFALYAVPRPRATGRT